MSLNEILSKLGVGIRTSVRLAINPRNGVELIQIDEQTKSIKTYHSEAISYNESLKEMADAEQLKQAVSDLFARSGVNPNSRVVLSVPAVHFGITTLPLILDNASVTEAIISEAEQVYLFNKNEPVVQWADLPTTGDLRRVVYAAIQKSEMEKIEYALSSVGAKIDKVEFSLFSIIRALSYGGFVDQIAPDMSWSLMVVNQNGYSISSVKDQMIVEYYEEPIPIKSFEGEDAYNALSASLNITMLNFATSHLYIVSETDLISAEYLSKKISFLGTVFTIDNNVHKKGELIPAGPTVLAEKAAQASLEAIGVGVYDFKQLPQKLEFSPTSSAADSADAIAIRIGGKSFELTKAQAQKIAIMIGAALVGAGLILGALMPILVKQEREKLDQSTTEMNKLKDEYRSFEAFGGNTEESEVEAILNSNRTALMTYSALGETVPKSLWLTYFLVVDKGKIYIKGQTPKTDDIYAFYKGLKNVTINNQLRLQKLELVSEDDAVMALTSDAPVVYEFVVTTMSDEEVSAKEAPPVPAEGQGAAAPPPPSNPSSSNSNSSSSLPPLQPITP